MKTEVEDYLIRARETLIESKFAHGSQFWNMSVNRSYYAMFYAVTAVLRTKEIVRSKHSGLVSAFIENFANTGLFEVKYAQSLNKGFKFRNVNDYVQHPIATEENSKLLLEEAIALVEKCEEYCNR